MRSVLIVRVPDWYSNVIVYSVHSTLKGAEKAVDEANKEYATSMAYIDEREVLA